ncbi:MAG: protein-export chaperone SecB [Pseudomonadales bacterium]|nr:protein-export chaperone SecB [Pseudomonadales bacterium]
MAENDNIQETPAAASEQDQANAPRFAVQRIYIKDASFEAPDSPESFRRPYSPQVNFSINSSNRHIENSLYEVILRLTTDVKHEDKTVFLVEVQQAGIFEVHGIDGERLEQVLNITCPSVLFPYGRESIDGLVIKGGFPPLMLAPINFEVLYAQAKKNLADKQAQEAASSGNTQ